MQLVENSYKDRVASNKWMIIDEDQETILALKAQILIKKEGNVKYKSKGKNKNRSQEKGNRERPKWMTVSPKKSESKKKTVNDQVYHWCHHHKAWTRHSPTECHFGNSNNIEKNVQVPKKKKKNGSTREFKMKVLQTFTEIPSSDDDNANKSFERNDSN